MFLRISGGSFLWLYICSPQRFLMAALFGIDGDWAVAMGRLWVWMFRLWWVNTAQDLNSRFAVGFKISE